MDSVTKIALCSLVLMSNSVLSEASGPRAIKSVGCHNFDNTCYMEISGEVVGPPECRSTSIRWNKKNDANGEAILTLVSAALFADKTVEFYLSSSCYVSQTNYPTISYLKVNK
jgi:hypothetical protein